MSASPPLAPRQLTLLQDMTIYHALEQKTLLLDALAEGRTLELDLSQVGAIDTAGLQLLLLIKREAGRAGKQLKLTGHSPSVRELIEFTQLAAHFGDPMVIPRNEAA
ncbi:MAG TPA: STAS domain-containing protein [Rhodocyclaceae bacterium]|nr:STAS domain-containing protein [Rhodocyclaceae bacterium]